MLGYFGVSIIHRAVTWTTGSLKCVSDFVACVYTLRTPVDSLTRRTFAESAQNWTLEKSEGGRKAQHVTVSQRRGDHVPSG